jgi:tetratricopeptide (TPR) repeat protein
VEAVPERYRGQRREVGELGLAAVIYYNHGAALAQDKRYHEAILANFRALNLDRENPAAARNARAELTNWGLALARAGKFEQAINVVAIGLRLDPDDFGLNNNRKVIWTEYAESFLAAGKDEEAMAVLRRAAGTAPKADFASVQAQLYLRRGEKHIDAGRWDEALAVAERGLAKVDAGPRKALRDWRAGVFVRWARAERKKGNFDQAVAALEKGLAAEPREADFPKEMGLLAGEWARAAEARGGPEQAAAVILLLQKRFPQMKELKAAALSYVYQVMRPPLRAGKYEEALGCIDRYYPDLLDKGAVKELATVAYDAWASDLRGKKDWQGAVDVYAKALGRYPRDAHLENNAVATYDRWAETFMQAKDWAGALGVYDKGLQQFPQNYHLSNNWKYCQNKMKK